MIVASAVMLKDERIFVGERHGDCYAKMKYLGLKIEECNNGAIQGFITDGLQFVDRNMAYHIAVNFKQCEEKIYDPTVYAKGLEIKREDWRPILMSEDLW